MSINVRLQALCTKVVRECSVRAVFWLGFYGEGAGGGVGVGFLCNFEKRCR